MPAVKREREDEKAVSPPRRVRRRDVHPAKRSDPEAEALAKAARCRCDTAVVGVQIVAPVPGPVDPDEIGPRLFGLVRRFLVESGCLSAARTLLDTLPPPASAAGATEIILQSRLRLVRVVAGWRAFACGSTSPLDGSALPPETEDRVRTVLRYCVALSRLDPHQPRQTRRVAAQMIGALAYACQDAEAREAAGRIKLGRPCAGCRAFLEAAAPVVTGWVGTGTGCATAFMRRWTRLQARLADADPSDAPLSYKPEDTPGIDEVVWTDPDSHAVSVVRPLFPKRGKIGAARDFLNSVSI